MLAVLLCKCTGAGHTFLRKSPGVPGGRGVGNQSNDTCIISMDLTNSLLAGTLLAVTT